MMISPEYFIEEQKSKSYQELLAVRDELLSEIRTYENGTDSQNEEWIVNPSPEVVYQCNLMYLGKLCQLIADQYNREFIWDDDEEKPAE